VAGRSIRTTLFRLELYQQIPHRGMDRVKQRGAAGLLLDVGGAILTLAALALAPVSVVQPILGCGLAFVAIFSHYLTADRLRASDWAACLLCVAVCLDQTPNLTRGHHVPFIRCSRSVGKALTLTLNVVTSSRLIR